MKEKRLDLVAIAAQLVEMSFAASDAERIIRDRFAVYRDLNVNLRAERRETARRKAQAYVNTLRRKRSRHDHKLRRND